MTRVKDKLTLVRLGAYSSYKKRKLDAAYWDFPSQLRYSSGINYNHYSNHLCLVCTIQTFHENNE